MTAFNTEFCAFIQTTGPAARLRLAPTPSGFLHLGNGVNFVLNWLAARIHPGARLLLRIDDLDAGRKRPEYLEDVFDTLDWLGLDWDEGPADAADFERQWSQHHRLDLYAAALDQLKNGGFLFPCSKSRRDLIPFGNHYPPAFRNQSCSFNDPDVAWRIRTPAGFALPDFVVRRRDGLPAYQLASLADDRFFGITHIIRGEDLTDSSKAQRFLAGRLGWEEFAHAGILHHPLLKTEAGEKLSKSVGAAALRHWRAEGRSPEPVFQQAAKWLHVPVEYAGSAASLLQAFRSILDNSGN